MVLFLSLLITPILTLSSPLSFKTMNTTIVQNTCILHTIRNGTVHTLKQSLQECLHVVFIHPCMRRPLQLLKFLIEAGIFEVEGSGSELPLRVHDAQTHIVSLARGSLPQHSVRLLHAIEVLGRKGLLLVWVQGLDLLEIGGSDRLERTVGRQIQVLVVGPLGKLALAVQQHTAYSFECVFSSSKRQHKGMLISKCVFMQVGSISRINSHYNSEQGEIGVLINSRQGTNTLIRVKQYILYIYSLMQYLLIRR